MATIAALAARETLAINRLNELKTKLAETLGAEFVDLPAKARDLYLNRVQNLEHIADTLDAILAKVAPAMNVAGAVIEEIKAKAPEVEAEVVAKIADRRNRRVTK